MGSWLTRYTLSHTRHLGILEDRWFDEGIWKLWVVLIPVLPHPKLRFGSRV